MLPSMWPMMVGYKAVPRPQMVSFSTTGVAYLKKRRQVPLPGCSSNAGHNRNFLLNTAWNTIMINSIMRDSRVATAAPTTPKAGAPSLPKMRIQFKPVLASMEMLKMIRPSLGFSMLR